jgi:EthD domain
MTITLVTLLKRRADLSRKGYRAYYETRHRKIGERVLGNYATRYVRRYLTPADGTDRDHDFDTILEIDFPDRTTMDACFAAMAEDAVMAEIVADEEKLFDRSRMRVFEVEECESVLPPIPA